MYNFVKFIKQLFLTKRSGDGLVPSDNKPLPVPMLTNCQGCPQPLQDGKFAGKAQVIKWLIHSLFSVPWECGFDFRGVILKFAVVITLISISSTIPLWWVTLLSTYDKSTFVQVMAWWCQATSHDLNQCWLRSMVPNGITRPQWIDNINSLWPSVAVKIICASGARLTKAYDVTIQRYRNSHTKIHDSKRIFCGVQLQNFV